MSEDAAHYNCLRSMSCMSLRRASCSSSAFLPGLQRGGKATYSSCQCTVCMSTLMCSLGCDTGYAGIKQCHAACTSDRVCMSLSCDKAWAAAAAALASCAALPAAGPLAGGPSLMLARLWWMGSPSIMAWPFMRMWGCAVTKEAGRFSVGLIGMTSTSRTFSTPISLLSNWTLQPEFSASGRSMQVTGCMRQHAAALQARRWAIFITVILNQARSQQQSSEPVK